MKSPKRTAVEIFEKWAKGKDSVPSKAEVRGLVKKLKKNYKKFSATDGEYVGELNYAHELKYLQGLAYRRLKGDYDDGNSKERNSILIAKFIGEMTAMDELIKKLAG